MPLKQTQLPESINHGLFGCECSDVDADLVISFVPWDVTASFRKGTADAPASIMNASTQCDTFNKDDGELLKHRIASTIFPNDILRLNRELSPKASAMINQLLSGNVLTDIQKDDQVYINTVCHDLHMHVKDMQSGYLKKGKAVGVIGGEHSVALGQIIAVLDHVPDAGILQIDAHMDFRDAYEGFTYSHASVMRHVVHHSSNPTLVQVGIRDYCYEEVDFARRNKKRIHTFFDADIARKRCEGHSWKTLCDEIINPLPKNVYLSLDVDGLSPHLFPDTGTPVPGGLTVHEVFFLLEQLMQSKRRIIGFDIVESGGRPNSLDVINAAHILNVLCRYCLRGQ